MLAGELAALVVEGIAVAVTRGLAHDADVAVVLQPAQLAVIGNVAPDEVTPDAVPRRTLGPQVAGIEPLNRRIADLGLELLVEDHNVGVRIARRSLAAPVPGGLCQDRNGGGAGERSQQRAAAE